MGDSNPSVNIGAIETLYAGCRFRSRLEARWAVFFDQLGIAWEYEPEGYVGCNGTRYLPDFYLPHDGVFVEVKGSDEQLRADSAKIGEAIDYNATPISKGLVILGPIPHVEKAWGTYVCHPLVYWRKGVEACFIAWDSDPCDSAISRWPETNLPWTTTSSVTEKLPDEVSVNARIYSVNFNGRANLMSQPVIDAYAAARQARFEHGQTPSRPQGALATTPYWLPSAPIGPKTGRAMLGGRARPEPRANEGGSR